MPQTHTQIENGYQLSVRFFSEKPFGCQLKRVVAVLANIPATSC